MAYVTMTKDFSEVKKPISGIGLTKRQLIAFGSAGLVGLSVFFLLKIRFGLDIFLSGMGMGLFALPIAFILLYKKDGMYIEKHIWFFYETYFIRNTDRPYETQNLYDLQLKEERFREEVEKIVYKGKSREEIKRIKASGEHSEIKVGKKKIMIPMKGPVDRQIKKELEKAVKKAKLHGEIPASAQETIPYEIPYEDGIFESAPGYFTQTISFEDITYQLLDNDPKDILFERWCSLINFFDEKVTFQLNYGNMEMNKEEYAKDFLIPIKEGDSKPIKAVSKEYSEMQIQQFSKGTNNLQKVRYLTYGIEAIDYKTAKRQLSKITKQLEKYFKKLGSKCKVLKGYERLELLHRMFHPGTKDKLLWNFDLSVKTGLSSKDFIAPSSFSFKPAPGFNATKYFKSGDRIGAASYIQIFANDMDDRIIWDILNINSNVWISIHGKALPRNKAIDLAKDNVSDIQKMIINQQKGAVQGGYDMDLLPPELLAYQRAGDKLYQDVQSKDENLINATILVIQTAATRKELEDNIFELNNIITGYQCKLVRLDNRQEQGYMSSLPLGINTVEVKRTFTTTDMAIFIPFTTKELYNSNGQYYGMNSLSNNVIMVDKKKLVNGNSLVLGQPGFGKTFAIKREIFDVFLKTDDHIMIIDPEGEYRWLVKLLGGQVIKIALNSREHINPMEINLFASNEDDKEYEPISEKMSFIVSLCEQMLGKNGSLDKDKIGVIDHACKKVYLRYAANPTAENMPVFEDLYNELRNMPDEMKEIGLNLSIALSRYVSGSLGYFNNRSNVDINSRLVCFDLKDIDPNQRDISMLIIQETIWDRVKLNRTRGIYTRVYMDEFHIFLRYPNTAAYSIDIWKRFRKWYGIPTGITQNVKDLFRSQEIQNILDTTNFIMLLNQAGDDARILAAHLDLSEEEMGYIQSGEPGKGLLCVGNNKVPFEDDFPKDTLCYKVMTSKPGEVIMKGNTKIKSVV
ncbi:MAG: VirB4-like conjugal transfer ATPase, CD1110 family [Lachnospiraceae bacterium]